MPDYPIPPDEVIDRTGATCRKFGIIYRMHGQLWLHECGPQHSFADAWEYAGEVLIDHQAVLTEEVWIVPWLAVDEIRRAAVGCAQEGMTYVRISSFDHFIWQDGQVVIGEHTL